MNSYLTPTMAAATNPPHPMSDFLQQNWGNILSLIGVIISIYAIYESTRASKAAHEARDIALRRNLSEDLAQIKNSAVELEKFIVLKNHGLTYFAISNLTSSINYALARWTEKLSEDTKNKLIAAREKLTVAHELLVKKSIEELGERQRISISSVSRDLISLLSESHGLAVKSEK
ncbi:hypothetical protein [Archangium sp.]|uniref:hypothetical protein n=1 Tax=Archangium sp. TaxID=1872627 RepID=UPI00389B26E3